jgi:hypothetical protein
MLNVTIECLNTGAKFWKQNIVLTTCYESMFESSHKKLNKKFNWAGNIRDILCRYGFNDII